MGVKYCHFGLKRRKFAHFNYFGRILGVKCTNLGAKTLNLVKFCTFLIQNGKKIIKNVDYVINYLFKNNTCEKSVFIAWDWIKFTSKCLNLETLFSKSGMATGWKYRYKQPVPFIRGTSVGFSVVVMSKSSVWSLQHWFLIGKSAKNKFTCDYFPLNERL